MSTSTPAHCGHGVLRPSCDCCVCIPSPNPLRCFHPPSQIQHHVSFFHPTPADNPPRPPKLEETTTQVDFICLYSRSQLLSGSRLKQHVISWGDSLDVTGASAGAPHPLALLFQLFPSSSSLLCGPFSQIWVLGRQGQRKDTGAGSNATPFHSLFSSFRASHGLQIRAPRGLILV